MADRLFVVGFDDNPLNDWIAPWLSSIRVPYDQLVEAIVEGLCERCDVPKIILPHEMVLRGPTAWKLRRLKRRYAGAPIRRPCGD
jgi:DNA-binding LacI/PurR family transcriptional regulator